MPLFDLNSSAASDNAIAASGARSVIIVTGGADFRWSFGATYVAADSQAMPPNTPLIIEGPLAANAISFGPSTNCRLNITTA